LITTNILSTPPSPTSKNKKKRRSSPPICSSSDAILPKIEIHQPTIPIPLINTQNPVTWNVNDVCSYLNQSGCSFALKTIKEQVKNIYLFDKKLCFLLIEGNRWCCSSSSR
jgi:hypothetical protein